MHKITTLHRCLLCGEIFERPWADTWDSPAGKMSKRLIKAVLEEKVEHLCLKK